jgi:RND superfamily putative drug exporter
VLDRLVSRITHRPGLVLALALLFVGAAGAIGGALPGTLTAGRDFSDPAAPSSLARQAVIDATGIEAEPGVIVVLDDAARAPTLIALLRADPAVGTVPPAVAEPAGHGAYVAAYLRGGAGNAAARRLEAAVAEVPGSHLGGAAIAYEQIGSQVSGDLARAELIAFPLIALLSLVLFRGLIASLTPLLVGGATITATLLALTAVNALSSLSIFAINLVTGLGLGLAIDYALLLVSRFREELARDGDPRAAAGRALLRAGRTIIWSALTVSVALASLMVFPQRFLWSMGAAGAIVPLVAALMTIIVLGPLLALLGPRIDRFALGRRRDRDAPTFWYRLSRLVSGRPVPFAAAGVAVLFALAAPARDARFTGIDSSVLPHSASARQVGDLLAARFPGSTTQPILVTSPGSLDRLAAQVAHLPNVADVRPVEHLGAANVLAIVPRDGSINETSRALVASVRALVRDPATRVGGRAAEFVDLRASILDRLPLALVLVVGSSLILLFLFTGSVVLPLKAVVMNLLTVGGAFGVLVLVFQAGRATGLLAYESQGALELTQPVLLSAIAFGLSTDYGVFLLGRILEERGPGISDREAVARGLERTGRTVTSAALLFCVAIGAFATSDIVFIKELGVGTAVAVLIDASIVRALLVPSLMSLLGRANWWAPAPLRAVHRRLGIHE